MEPQPSGPLGLELRQATECLQSALADVCGTKIEHADTGQLLRVEEALSTAAEAAKRAVSIRQSRRRNASTAIDSDGGATHREFVDAAGQRWDAFAVHPSEAVSNRARLPDPYRTGWLSFASGDERRRLSPVPDGWEELTDDALRALCARAISVPRRTSPPRNAGDAP